MSSAPAPAPQVPIEDVVGPVAGRAEQRARELGRPVLASIGVPVAFEEPLSLLQATNPTTAGWWAAPGLRAAGAEVATFAEAAGPNRFSDLAGSVQRWFEAAEVEGRAPIAFAGGAYFGGTRPADGWEGFPEAATWIPEVCALRDDDGTWLIASTLVFRGDAEAAAQHLVTVLTQGLAAVQRPMGDIVIGAASAGDGQVTPDELAWKQAVEDVLGRIDRHVADKVVLARRRTQRCDDAPWITAARFAAAYPECTCYGARLEGRTFLGASPELLVSRNGVIARSAPAAGTVSRGEDGLTQAKPRHEQQLVTEGVVAALQPFASQIRTSDPAATLAGPVEHLATQVEATLRTPAPHVLELAGALHPTPAVGGTPLEEAQHLQRVHEGFDRGWYAGPIGICTPGGDGALAIALRCALLHDGVADLFAGAGIVAGSDADAEAAEIDLKLSAAARVL